MKIRTGFVSNSSSSSFIISEHNFPTVRSLAKRMIEIQAEDYEDDEQFDRFNYKMGLIDRLKNVPEDHPISFSSCNYDTYIRKVGDCLFVSTCNNTHWDLWEYTTRITDAAKDELKEMLNDPRYSPKNKYNTIEYILDGDDCDFSHFGIDFYDLDNDIVGVQIFEDCPKKDENHRYNYMWNTVKYGKICLICDKRFLERKEKLEKLNKI